jgi:hypothetical protein
MDLNSRQLVWRSGLLLRRAAWDRHRRLVREISAYRTPAEREELFAAIERCSSPAREEIRRLVARTATRAEAESSPFHLRP